MRNLAKTLIKCKSYKERQKRLSESIDQLSFDYPDMFSLISREMKKREIDSNDPNKISKWINTSDSYMKLHEALILVKNSNMMAKEEYLDRLKRMLKQTIENGTNIDKTLKICRLIEKSAHLASIYEPLKCLIQQVNQINCNKLYDHKQHQAEYLKPHNVNQILVDSLNSLKIQCNQLQYIPVWSTMLQPNYVEPFNNYPNFNLNFTHRNSAFDIAQPVANLNLTIIDQDMDGAFADWLRYLKLHKYQWFFNGLSYLEIECIDEENIDSFIAKVNKNSITKGAQKKICLSTKILRDRQKKLYDLSMSLDLEVTPNELCEHMTYMVDILHYPIPNKHCVVGDQLQQIIACVMEKLLNQLLEKLSSTKLLVAQSLIGTSINKFLECTLLIIGNQTFMKEQVDMATNFAEKLKFQVRRMPKDFD